MNLETLTELLIPISTFVTLITASIGGWLALKEYRLKVKAETRLAESSELESDIKLLKLFTEIMDIAHGRGGYEVSEKVMEKILSPEVLKQLNVKEANLRDLIRDAIISFPVGVAAQDAAISAIWVLGKKHSVLTPVAIQALESLSEFKGEVTKEYLEDLKTANPKLAYPTFQNDKNPI